MKIRFQPNVYNQQRQDEKKAWIYPVLLAMYATLLKNQGHEVLWDSETFFTYDKTITSEEQIDVSFLSLPHPNRNLTRAFEPKYQQNGNFKYLPGTYMQSALDCWYAQCTFCKWAKLYPKVQTRSVTTMLREVEQCRDMGFKEIFDDSGTFPMGEWLYNFIHGLCQVKNKVRISCNMRLDYHHPNLHGLKWMRKAGFRMILYGLESANQRTLDKLNKGINIDSAIHYIKQSAIAGLETHISAMVGFPWETKEEVLNTVNLVQSLLIKGYAKTAQMSFYTPSSGSQGNEAHRKYVTAHYKVAFNPLFWYNKIVAIRSVDDFNYLIRGIKKGATALCQGRLT